jgi:N-terminal domain on NACHT_NTPase and P-loop NTPases
MELAAVEGAAGLASSIITFINFSVKFGKLVRNVAQAQGALPKEFEECQEYIQTVAAWLTDISRSLRQDNLAQEDKHLEQAIQRCMRICEELVLLLQTLCDGAGQDPHVSMARRTRKRLGNVKRAGKIMWKQDQITRIRDKLRKSRDDVHAHLGSRLCHQVKKLL